MAYDRYDTHDDHSRWSDDRSRERAGRSGRSDDRGFFERAGDEIASWFGDDDAERRRRQDQMRDDRGPQRGDRSRESSAFGRGWASDRGNDRDYDRGYGRDYDRDRESSARHRDHQDRGGDRGFWSSERARDRNDDRGMFNRGGSSDRDYNPNWRDEFSSRDRDDRSRDRDRNRAYRPMAGDYGRSNPESDQYFAASGYGRGDSGRDRDSDRSERDRSQSAWGRDDYRRSSRAGTSDPSDRSRHEDPHYSSWRDRHMSDLDRDYDDYRREHQAKFENEFGSWRDKRQEKRRLLSDVREHMEVVGDDEKHVGTVDKIAGDRVILTKSDPASGGSHHSISCSDIGRVEGDRVFLDCSAEQAKRNWRDESRDRALFEREDQGEMGPRTLNRSFEGTYR